MKRRNNKDLLLITGGVLLIAAALLMTGKNLWENRRAQIGSRVIMEKLDEIIPDEEEESALPDAPMPTQYIDGYNYIAILIIPALSLELPVMEEWDYDRLRVSPCRYAGSVYTDDLVIAAHNYTSHFGELYSLSLGDEVNLTDMDGNSFIYHVAEITILQPHEVEEMTSSEWDLTLFTCTLGGRTRVTVHCERDERS